MVHIFSLSICWANLLLSLSASRVHRRTVILSPLDSATLPLEVISSEGKMSLHVHERVLEAIPYFSAQKARWTTGSLKVELPDGTSVADLTSVLEQTYFSLRSPSPTEVRAAMRSVQVASMLNADVATMDYFIRIVRSTLRSEEEISLLRNFTVAHAMPSELSKLTNRLDTSSEHMDERSLLELYTGAAASHDADMLMVASKNFKYKSRQGDAGLEQVARILATDVGFVGSSIALQFAEAHPKFYKMLVESLFARTGPDWASEDGKRFFLGFMNLGVKHYLEGRIALDFVVAFFIMVTQWNIVPRALSGQRDILPQALKQLDVTAQLAICKVLVWLPDREFLNVIDVNVVDSLPVEVKDVLADRGKSLFPQFLETWLTKDMLRAFGKPLTGRFLGSADGLPSDVKKTLLGMFMPPGMEESDEGF